MPFPLNEAERFAKVHHSRDLESVFQALACRDLQPIDLCVLLALVSHMDRVGRARVTATAVASQLNIAAASCIRATSRLRKQKVIVKIRDPKSNSVYFVINPFVASIGNDQNRGHLVAQFEAALEEAS